MNLTFWESFLDMMVTNRYNVITLWALHPWPYMVTPTNFPVRFMLVLYCCNIQIVCATIDSSIMNLFCAHNIHSVLC